MLAATPWGRRVRVYAAAVGPLCEHMFVKLRERNEARRLRRDCGWPLSRIARELSVAKSTVSLWVRDIELTPEQMQVLRDANPLFNMQLRGQTRRRETARAKRLEYQREGRRLAARGDPLHLAGCMLYWAEGSRRRNSVTFTNSDPRMLMLFARFLTRCYRVELPRIRLSCNCFLGNGLSLQEIEGFWLRTLGLTHESLCASIVNRPSPAGTATKRTLPYGTARVCVHSTEIVQSIYGAIQEYAGIECPEWLDCEAPSGQGRTRIDRPDASSMVEPP